MRILPSQHTLNEDSGDVVIYMNPDQFIERVKGKTYSRELWNRTKLALEAAANSTPVLKVAHGAVFAELRKDKRLAELLKAEGLKLQNIYEGHVDDITQAVFETTEGGELPFHGELIVEGDDGQSVTLDEADLMEDVIIEALEEAIAEAVASDPNAHATALREIDEALSEGDYETAMESGCALLARCGVDEARIEEFKKGFKTSATQRSRMGRMRVKAKTGTQLMALRQRRRAARKGGARTKRARYYKSNKRRITRRRAQLTNSVDLNAAQVVEMAEQGMTFVVLQDGEEPVFASSREIAEALAGDDGVVVELTKIQIEEAFKKSGKKGKPFFAKKKADDAEDEGDEDETDESLAEKKDCDDEDEDEDEDDYEDDEDETDESIEESAVSKLANEIAKFLKQHPRVGYGELATRFKVGRDVAQQAVILASNSAKAKGDQASWLWLAKEIMGKIMNHSAGTQRPAAPVADPAKLRQVASVQDDGADLTEAGTQGTKPKITITAGNKPGVTKVSKQALPKPKLKGKVGSIKSAHGRGESVEDQDDDLDEVSYADVRAQEGRRPYGVRWRDGAKEERRFFKTDAERDKFAEKLEKDGRKILGFSDNGIAGFSESVEDQDDDLDEVQDKNGGSQTHQMGKGKGATPKAGPSKLHKPTKLTREDDEDGAETDGDELVEVSAPIAKAEALVAAAAQNGLDSTTKVQVKTAEGVVSMFVPADVADAIRQAVA